MKHYLLYTIFLLLLLFSCSDPGVPVVTYDVVKTDFTDYVDAIGTVQAVRTTAVKAPSQSGLTLVWLIEDGSRVEEGDTLCKFSSESLLTRLQSAKDNLVQIQNTVSSNQLSLDIELESMERTLEASNLDMTFMKLDSVRRPFMTPLQQKIFDLRFRQAKIRQEKLFLQQTLRKSRIASSRRSLQSALLSSEAQIKSVQTTIDRLSVVAPHSGIVLRLEREGSRMMVSSASRREGGTTYRTENTSVYDSQPIVEGIEVFPGEEVLSIPDMSLMRIRLMVPEIDYKRIEYGQKVQIQVESANNLVTTGSVEKKTLASGVTSSQPRNRRGANATVKKYEIIISVDSCHTQMKPGLSAQCRILVSDIKDTIVVPSIAIFVLDSTKVAYVEEGEMFRPVPVETGLSNSSRSIVSKGLKPGQTIALMEPPYQRLINVVLPRNIKAESVDSTSSESDSVIQLSSTQ